MLILTILLYEVWQAATLNEQILLSMCDFLPTILTVYLTIPFSQIVLDIKRPVSYVQEQNPLLSYYIALGD